MAATVDDLGVPDEDGVLGTIHVDPSVQPEHLVWDLAAQRWVGRARYTCRMIDEPFGSIQGGSIAAWDYAGASSGAAPDNPSAVNFPFSDPNDKGFQPHHWPRPDLLYGAGLRMQESLQCEILVGDGLTPRVAINWYELDENDPFLSPPPLNIGVELVGIPDNNNLFRFAASGWQNSPVAVPTKTKWYPLPYLKGSSGFHCRKLTARARLIGRPTAIGGPGLGAGGGVDFRSLPPLTRKLCSQNVADNIPLADGASVSEWIDASTYGRHFQQASGTKKPLLVRNAPGWNGHAVVRFDGVNDVLHALSGEGALAVLPPFVVFLALKQYATGGAQQVWHEGLASAQPLIYRSDAVDALGVWDGGAELTYHIPGGWAAEPRLIISAKIDGAASDVWHNNTEVLSGSMGANAFTGASLGAAWDDTLPAKIEVAEYLVYADTLTDPERTAIVDYLNAKYTVF